MVSFGCCQPVPQGPAQPTGWCWGLAWFDYGCFGAPGCTLLRRLHLALMTWREFLLLGGCGVVRGPLLLGFCCLCAWVSAVLEPQCGIFGEEQ